MSNSTKRIGLQDAIDWTQNFRANPDTQARAFLIPIQDLEGVLQEINSEGGEPMARAYLAYDIATGQEKLVIVGTSQEVQKDGSVVYRDMLPDLSEDPDTSTFGIWDFTRRCPPHCDDNSPLNQ